MRNSFETGLNTQLTKARTSTGDKIVFKYEPCKLDYVISGTYKPDWGIQKRKSEDVLYIEAKGYLRIEHKRKMIAVKKCNPFLDIRFVFQRYNKKDIKWAEKYGFPWSINHIPQEWLDE